MKVTFPKIILSGCLLVLIIALFVFSSKQPVFLLEKKISLPEEFIAINVCNEEKDHVLFCFNSGCFSWQPEENHMVEIVPLLEKKERYQGYYGKCFFTSQKGKYIFIHNTINFIEFLPDGSFRTKSVPLPENLHLLFAFLNRKDASLCLVMSSEDDDLPPASYTLALDFDAAFSDKYIPEFKPHEDFENPFSVSVSEELFSAYANWNILMENDELFHVKNTRTEKKRSLSVPSVLPQYHDLNKDRVYICNLRDDASHPNLAYMIFSFEVKSPDKKKFLAKYFLKDLQYIQVWDMDRLESPFTFTYEGDEHVSDITMNDDKTLLAYVCNSGKKAHLNILNTKDHSLVGQLPLTPNNHVRIFFLDARRIAFHDFRSHALFVYSIDFPFAEPGTEK